VPGTLASALALLAAAVSAAQPVPDDLTRLVATARLASPVVGWCRGEFRSGRTGAYAVATASAAAGGRYAVIESDATIVELASFTGPPEVACYTPARARQIDATIARSDGIHGKIEPRWGTTVVCGFVDETSAVCWQYSPDERRFVRVGEWIT
jgi:hypothetical protein